MPIFGQKTYILSKLHYLLGHKSQYICFFNRNLTISWGKGGGGGRIGVGLEVKLLLQSFWISTIYA